MEVTFYYGSVMPKALKNKIESHFGDELQADFDDWCGEHKDKSERHH